MTQLDSSPPATSESVLHQFVQAVTRHSHSPFRLVDLTPHPSVLWANTSAPEPALEQFRILRTKLLQHPAKPGVILVASPCPEDGKSTTAINLAGMLAFRHRTLLLDCPALPPQSRHPPRRHPHRPSRRTHRPPRLANTPDSSPRQLRLHHLRQSSHHRSRRFPPPRTTRRRLPPRRSFQPYRPPRHGHRH